MPRVSGRLRLRQSTLTLFLCLYSTIVALAQPGPAKISSATWRPADGGIEDGNQFGFSVASLGDIDGDGITDIAVGSPHVRTGGEEFGAVWILRLNSNGSVKGHSRIARFDRPIPRDPDFGRGLTQIGDFDGDGVSDLATISETMLSVLYLEPDGSVKDIRPVSTTTDRDIERNRSVSLVGDINKDGQLDLALVREHSNPPRVILGLGVLRPDLSIDRTGAFSAFDLPGSEDFTASFGGPVVDYSGFGSGPNSITSFPDPRKDGDTRLVIGAPDYEEGAVWIISIYDTLPVTPEGSSTDSWVEAAHPIKAIDGLTAHDDNGNRFGISVDTVGDLDGDGIFDLVVGAPRDDEDGDDRGAVYVLFTNMDGTRKKTYQKINETSGRFGGTLKDGDLFGYSIASLGDINRDGYHDVAVGAPLDDDGGTDRGAVWILFNIAAEPEITLDPSQSIETNPAGDIEVTAHINDLKGVATASLSYRPGGYHTFSSVSMTPQTAGLFTASIPAFSVGATGVEYFVTATSTRGLESTSPTTGVASLSIAVPSGLTTSITGGLGSHAYRLVSVPLDLEEESARSIFEDDLGSYEEGNWRLFALDSGSRNVELGVDDMDVTPGRGYWMIVRDESAGFNTGPGTSVRTDRRFPIPLWRGWNLIGNPFAFEVPISNIRNGSDAVPELWRFTGSWESGTETLLPFEGYALKSRTVDTLWIDPNMTRDQDSGLQSTAREEHRPSNWQTQADELEAIFGTIAPENFETEAHGIGPVSSHPNPFSKNSTIGFELQQTEQLSLRVYDTLGRLVSILLDGELEAGFHSTVWDGTDDVGTRVAAGIYFFGLETDTGLRTGTVTLTR